jgi:transposase-like protein
MERRGKYSKEVRERAVRMVQDEAEHESPWATICSIAEKIRLHGRDVAEVDSASGRG